MLGVVGAITIQQRVRYARNVAVDYKTLPRLMGTHQETEYVLSNPRLMQQIRQFKHNSKKSNPSQVVLSLDFDYILKNPELITQIQLLIETHKQKHHALSRIS